MDVEKRGGGKELLQVKTVIILCVVFFFYSIFSDLAVNLCRCRSASVPEAGEAALQSHASHPGSQGRHEGHSLTDEAQPIPSCLTYAVHR